MKYSPQKSIFMLKYEPRLSFFNNLYKNGKLNKKFPHWQTNRLRLILRDYDKKHSLTIAHGNAVFESDKYDKLTEKEIISLLISEITSFIDDGTFSEFSFQHFYLIKQKMSFRELVEVINLNCFTQDFKQIFQNKISDSTITTTLSVNGNNVTIMLGPIRKEEIPRFVRYNVDNHIDPDPQQRARQVSEIFKNYPEVALFLDIRYYLTGKRLRKDSLDKFWELSKKDIPKIVDDITNGLFTEKIKK